MKKTLFFSFGLCFLCANLSFHLSAQEYKNFDLNKYYTPDIVRNQLDLNFDTDGSISERMYYNSGFMSENDTLNANNLYGRLNSFFFKYKNTRKNESLLQLNLGLSGQSQNFNGDPILYDSNKNSLNSSENIGLTYINKSYNSTKQFLSFGITSRLNYSSQRNVKQYINAPELTTIGSYFTSFIAPYVGIGVGRIERVTDARQAIYILDDLAKNGVLSRHLSNDEILELSQHISRVKNKRFLDSRLHKIDEITAIDSFLVSNQLLTKSDAIYFTTLYDNWENGSNFERKSGRVFEIQLSPSINWYNIKNQTDTLNGSSMWNKQRNNNYGIGLSFNYINTKQLNQNLEKIAEVSLMGATSSNTNSHSTQEGEISYNENNSAITLSGSYGIGYYPSTRTHLSAKLSQNFVQVFYTGTNDNSWSNHFSSTSNLNFSAVYYVSPQLSLSGNAVIYNNYEKSTYSTNNYNSNKLGAGFSASLKYSFF